MPLPSLTAGSHTVSAVYSGDSSYAGSTGVLADGQTVNKATPLLTWSDPASIVYGTVLSATQLDATASFQGQPLAGIFTYSPPAGTVLHVGAGQTLSVSFAPTDSVDFATATTSVAITITPAATTTSAASATATYGDASVTLTATLTSSTGSTVNQGSATFTVMRGNTTIGSVNASVSNAAAAASFPLAGVHAGAYTIGASYADNASPASFQPSSAATTTLTVNPTSLTITANNTSREYGAGNPTFAVSFAGLVNGDTAASLTGALGVFTNAASSSPVGSYAVVPSGVISPDYHISFVGGSLTITPARTTTTVSDATARAADSTVALSATLSSDSGATVNEGTVTFTVTQGSRLVGSTVATVANGAASATFALSGIPAGQYTVTAGYNDGASPANFQASSATGRLTVAAAPSETLALTTGWHLVTLSVQPASTKLTNILAPIAGSYDVVFGFDQSLGGITSYFTDPSKAVLNNLTDLLPLHGYWVHLTGSGNLSWAGQ